MGQGCSPNETHGDGFGSTQKQVLLTKKGKATILCSSCFYALASIITTACFREDVWFCPTSSLYILTIFVSEVKVGAALQHNCMMEVLTGV